MTRTQACNELRPQPTPAQTGTVVLALALISSSLAALPGCEDGSAPPADDLGQVVADIQQAPANARCVVITVTNGTLTVARQFNLAPQTSSVFILTGLPTGTDTFTANAFAISCAQVVSTTTPTFVSDPIMAMVTTGMPFNITFEMHPAGAGGTVGVGVDFPTPTTGQVTEVTLPSTAGPPGSIATGSDGSLWVGTLTQIVQVPLVGSPTGFPLAASSDARNGIASGADGNLWFTEFVGNRIGHITPAGVVTVSDLLPNANSDPLGITAGPDGAMWFTEEAGRIGRISLSGVVTEFVAPTGADPFRITAGADGNLWFTELFGGRVGRITPAGVITEFTPPTSTFLEGIALGPDGNVWFAETANRIGRISPSGSIVEFTIPTPNSAPAGLAAGPDGNVWFTEEAANQIGRITPLGVITEFPVPTPNADVFTGITLGPDGGIWFTEGNVGKIGRIQP